MKVEREEQAREDTPEVLWEQVIETGEREDIGPTFAVDGSDEVAAATQPVAANDPGVPVRSLLARRNRSARSKPAIPGHGGG